MIISPVPFIGGRFPSNFLFLGTFFLFSRPTLDEIPSRPRLFALPPCRRTQSFHCVKITPAERFPCPMYRLLLILILPAVVVVLSASAEEQQQSAEQPSGVLLDLVPTEFADNKRSLRRFAFAKRAQSFAFAKRNAADGWGRAFAFAKRAEMPQGNEKRFAFADGGVRRFAFAKRNYRQFAFAR